MAAPLAAVLWGAAVIAVDHDRQTAWRMYGESLARHAAATLAAGEDPVTTLERLLERDTVLGVSLVDAQGHHRYVLRTRPGDPDGLSDPSGDIPLWTKSLSVSAAVPAATGNFGAEDSGGMTLTLDLAAGGSHALLLLLAAGPGILLAILGIVFARLARAPVPPASPSAQHPTPLRPVHADAPPSEEASRRPKPVALSGGEDTAATRTEVSGNNGPKACERRPGERNGLVEEDTARELRARLLSLVSHELRTPLNAIVGFAELLRNEPDGEVHAEFAETIRRAARDLSQRIDGILDYASIEAGELSVECRSIPFYDLLAGTLALVRPTALDKGLDVYLYIDPQVPETLTTDPYRLRQALINLLVNAIRFTPRGHVALEVHRYADPAGQRIQIEVHDTGPGIPPGQDDILVWPQGPRTRNGAPKGSGIGLGLAVAREIVTRLGGQIGHQPREHGGTTFWLNLPCEMPRTPLYFQRKVLTPTRVLVYDAQPVRGDYTRWLLEGWGLDAVLTDSLEAFRGRLAEESFGFVFYFLDRDEVDSGLRVSVDHLAATEAVTVFMHARPYANRPAPASGFLHLSQGILPHHLHHCLYEAQHASDTTQIRVPEPPGVSPERLDGLRILVADDNPVNRRLLEAYITRNRGQCISAASGREAVDCADDTIDAVIMDIQMPEMDGPTALKILKTERPDLPVIAFTADADGDAGRRFLDMGFDACIGKPFSERHMLDALSQARNASDPSATRAERSGESVPRDLQVIHTTRAIEAAGENRPLAQELYDMFVTDLASHHEALGRETPEAGPALSELAHRIAGGARFCAAERVYDAAFRLETASREGADGTAIARLKGALSAAVSEVLETPNPYRRPPSDGRS